MSMRGKTCVVTGATSGLGKESARALAAAGAHVVLAARNADALAGTRDWVRAEVPWAQVSCVVVDLASLDSVRTAATQIAAVAPVIDVLMNNAGVMFTPFGHTRDGFETQFGTNHLGHFTLTVLLRTQFVKGTRIVNLSSEGHRLGDIDLDDPNWQRRGYDKFAAYGAAKTANILHAVALDRRLHERGIRAFAVHPGMVATNLARHMSREDVVAVSGQARSHAIEVLTPEQGVATQVWAATSPDLDGRGGVYLADCAERSDAEPYATDPARAERLWEVSESLCAWAIS
ncbi:short-chain dehydrogenase [Mycolicibacterium conceptionense]|uniref:Short-chain dehydrogenase n=1 Tax=Mycolicibacterium conceptionense TaxID=451644 RepID=A0A1A2UXG4_9MYCO|nr:MULTISPECIES: SDR family NAD(P)-dependent oxidoreductase [Mycolicibacterium]MCW1820514.1 SDR family NAD(P)-dependent oxidoreductase [Mycolicibacterium senegalense]OBB12083.1 short-chain dehydrogenase [Mycolicibacterium conceptionense]OBF04458.1 short-chain dehydrogenase [Mycolicibacterium conceptionense]OBF13320.1 short-chain dehydrogenase [Mycolicibacterium conceptionense]OBF44677.1 short-chain dehydrogenase [Mycolicibacterium conceptionense]